MFQFFIFQNLYPSSLLDCLFENPDEDKPNVLVITLYSIDIGYSIKITMPSNELPVETFFNYDNDTILKHVENEQLPPDILGLLEKAEPSLFYCGCVIAEIHDQQNELNGQLYRILLRPSNLVSFINSNYEIYIPATFHIYYQLIK